MTQIIELAPYEKVTQANLQSKDNDLCNLHIMMNYSFVANCHIALALNDKAYQVVHLTLF